MSYKAQHTYDAELMMKDSGAVTSSGAWTVASAAKVIDTGGGHFEGDLILDVTAIKISGNDEIYTIVLQGSPDSAFTAATSVELMNFNLSAKEVKITDTDRDDTTGVYVLPFTNVFGGTQYRYLRGYTVTAGTDETITFSARIGLRK